MWIESHDEIERHPKTLDLATFAGWDIDVTIAKLHRFWWWCAHYAEDGDLSKHPPERIARAVGLPPEQGEVFRDNLVRAGWLDTEPYLRVHDWWDYIGRFLQVKYGKRSPEKWQRVRDLYSASTVSVTADNTASEITKPNLTNQTKPGEEIESPVPVLDDCGWNEFAKQHDLSPIVTMTKKRSEGVRARKSEPAFDLPKIYDEIVRSDFLRGSNDRGWKVDFDFIFCNPNKYPKILEGKYRNGNGKTQSSNPNSQVARATFQHGEKDISRLRSLNERLKLISENGDERPGADSVSSTG